MLALLIILAQPAQPQLRPVEAGFQDVSPLANSLLLEPLDLHAESDFSRVYEIELGTRLLGHRAPRLFARRAGGITAVFPQASYRPMGEGLLLAEVPNDTVFLIGDDPGRMLGDLPDPVAPSASQADLFTDLRVGRASRAEASNQSAPARGPRGVAPPESQRVSIWSDAEYRMGRIGSLLDSALASGR
ncbi:hypothetical protein PHYC_02880 [Phycisphaerales bacterium]|nr:hypothetical protein PHYC_02880 [Phycisphaerales bacterium]